MAASRLNEAGFWRGGNAAKPPICSATTSCISQINYPTIRASSVSTGAPGSERTRFDSGAALGHPAEEDVKAYWAAVGPRGGAAVGRAGYGAVGVSPYGAAYRAYYG